MLQGEHSAILSTFIKLPFVLKTLVLSIFEWPLNTDFTVIKSNHLLVGKKSPYLELWFEQELVSASKFVFVCFKMFYLQMQFNLNALRREMFNIYHWKWPKLCSFFLYMDESFQD